MEETCLADSGTTNTILRETKYFESITKIEGNITTIAGCGPHVVGSGRATIVLPMGTTLVINDALLYPESTRTLLSFEDIRVNGFHIETHDDVNGKARPRAPLRTHPGVTGGIPGAPKDPPQ